MGIIASVDRGLVDGLRTLNRMDDGALRRRDDRPTAVQRQIGARETCLRLRFHRMCVTRFTDFHVGLRRGDIPTGGNLTKVSTYSNSNDTTRHKAYGTPNSRDNTTRDHGTRTAPRFQLTRCGCSRLNVPHSARRRASRHTRYPAEWHGRQPHARPRHAGPPIALGRRHRWAAR
jgi:hypothetical protein